MLIHRMTWLVKSGASQAQPNAAVTICQGERSPSDVVAVQLKSPAHGGASTQQKAGCLPSLKLASLAIVPC